MQLLLQGGVCAQACLLDREPHGQRLAGRGRIAPHRLGELLFEFVALLGQQALRIQILLGRGLLEPPLDALVRECRHIGYARPYVPRFLASHRSRRHFRRGALQSTGSGRGGGRLPLERRQACQGTGHGPACIRRGAGSRRRSGGRRGTVGRQRFGRGHWRGRVDRQGHADLQGVIKASNGDLP